MNKIRRYKKLRTVYGIWNGYPFIISNMNEKIVDLSFSVSNPNKFDIESEIINNSDQALRKKIGNRIVQTGNEVSVGIKRNIANSDAKLEEVLNAITSILQMRQYEAICSITGSKDDVGVYRVGGKIYTLSETAYQTMIEEENSENKDNLVKGLLGALGGLAIGITLWIIVSLMGYVSGWIGAIIPVLAFSGYGKFGGTMNKSTAIGLFVVSVLSIAFAHYLSYVVQVMDMYGASLSVSMEFTNIMLSSDKELFVMFVGETLIGVAFGFFMGIAMAKNAFDNKGFNGTSEMLIASRQVG